MNVWFVTLWTSEEDWYPTLQKIKPLLKQHHEADCTTCEGKPHMHLTLWFAEPVKQRSICAWFGVPGAAVRNNMHPSTPHSVQFFKYSRYGLKADEEKVKKPKITTDTIREFWADNPKARRKDIFDFFPAALYNSKIYDNILKYKPNLEWLPEKKIGFWFSGVSDAGKTHCVHEIVKSAFFTYYKMPAGNNYRFWVDYDWEEVVQLAEVSPDKKPQSGLLKEIVDKEPCLVELKYGHIHARPKLVFVTSNFTLEDCYREHPEDLPALRNRFYQFTFHHAWPSIQAAEEQTLIIDSVKDIITQLYKLQ